jgi:hypothetical protein
MERPSFHPDAGSARPLTLKRTCDILREIRDNVDNDLAGSGEASSRRAGETQQSEAGRKPLQAAFNSLESTRRI